MKPKIFIGNDALTDFKKQSLLMDLNKDAANGVIDEIIAKFIYFIEIDNVLSPEQKQKSKNLLDFQKEFTSLDKEQFFVIPRKGTISPWSSKATDIFHNCGMSQIKRVERGILYQCFGTSQAVSLQEIKNSLNLFHDRMVEEVCFDVEDIFSHRDPMPFCEYDILNDGINALHKANKDKGLALSNDEIKYLFSEYQKINRNPTDVELLMFGQVNSEHCRHKIFNAEWIIDGEKKDVSLFQMIKNTHLKHPEGTLVAYKDNSSVIAGFDGEWFEVDLFSKNYGYSLDKIDIIMKVETHNHPTAISPYPGAATGVGGEIRDEGATGIGSKSKAGLCAFMVSNLNIPDFKMPWEFNFAEFPAHLASPLDIMIEGPIGGARFGNEFGRPNLCGIFKTYEQKFDSSYFGYHKPIMVAGGMGNIKRRHTEKKEIEKGAFIVQIGGPALKIGIGGGAASSMDSGSNALNLDFNSVQRDNAEMQRRCQEVINTCIALNDVNPILSIHDVGAGGLSNASPELIAETGGEFWLRSIHNEEGSMSPMEIWCCEAQERYVLAISKDNLQQFVDICSRERCPVAVYGKATGDGHLSLFDKHFNNKPIDIDLKVILGKPPKLLKDVTHKTSLKDMFDTLNLDIKDAVDRILHLPCVANKNFLITIADRSITGMVARDQMVGPYQTPISNVAVTSSTFTSVTGEAMSMGEKTNTALLNAAASGKMAIGEALTNIVSANIGKIGNVKLSANWMCACGEPGEDANLFDTVKAVGIELCPQLGISIPVGKDSLSMRTVWTDSKQKNEKITAPLSLIVSAFASVQDVTKTVTPDLKKEESALFLIDLGHQKNRIGGSALAQVYNRIGDQSPSLDNPDEFVAFFNAIQELIKKDLILAYHDRSDGGLFVTLAEMSFGARKGLEIDVGNLNQQDIIRTLFSEELGAVIQVDASKISFVIAVFDKYGLSDIVHKIGKPADNKQLTIRCKNELLYFESITTLNQMWSELTYKMQSLRDNPKTAKEEFDDISDENNPGISFKLSYDVDQTFNISLAKPKVIILREQGINGHVEMAAAFEKVGFEACDVHMTDLINNKIDLLDYQGMVACGGFSYGDVLGAGSGWAKSILYNKTLRSSFERFFAHSQTFSLGVCNGCQMLSQLKEIIPGALSWPHFVNNLSGQFEARYVSVQIHNTSSILFKDMSESILSIPVAHGEGLVDFSNTGNKNEITNNSQLVMSYVDNYGQLANSYPYNPNGSLDGMTGFTSKDGRVTIMMPHPERVFRSLQLSYDPLNHSENSPWLRMFQNARLFVE